MKKKNYFLYCRCSDRSQSTTSQKRELKKAYPTGVFFEEKISGVSQVRPQREKMIEQLDENSCIVVTRMSRLSRSLSDLFDVMATIAAKGSDIVFLKENIDTTTSQGRLAFNLMACINSYTRELISESCREGRAAKEEDPNFEGWGRPDKWDKRKKSHIRKLKREGKSIKDIVNLTGVPRSTVYLILKPEKRDAFNGNLKEAINQKKNSKVLVTKTYKPRKKVK